MTLKVGRRKMTTGWEIFEHSTQTVLIHHLGTREEARNVAAILNSSYGEYCEHTWIKDESHPRYTYYDCSKCTKRVQS